MAKIKSVVLNKTEITDRHYIVEFYNPWWGRFAIDFKYDNASHAEHNMLNIMFILNCSLRFDFENFISLAFFFLRFLPSFYI